MTSYKRTALTFAIALLFPLLIHYGIETFYPTPHPETVALSGQVHTLSSPNTRSTDAFIVKYNQHQKITFYVNVILGLIVILLGTVIKFDTIGSGLIFGGAITLLSGYLGYWSNLDAPLKFVSLLIAFLLILFIASRKS